MRSLGQVGPININRQNREALPQSRGHESFFPSETGERSEEFESDGDEDAPGRGTVRYSGDIEPTEQLSVSTDVGMILGVDAPEDRAAVSASSLRKASSSRSNL